MPKQELTGIDALIQRLIDIAPRVSQGPYVSGVAPLPTGLTSEEIYGKIIAIATENNMAKYHAIFGPKDDPQSRIDATYFSLLDPATVTQLCRLAEIGRIVTPEVVDSLKRLQVAIADLSAIDLATVNGKDNLIDIASTVIRALIANRTAAPAIEELEAAVSII